MPRILHYPGSKWRIAKWIIEQMPPHETYLEPFFGSGAVLFTKDRSKLETVNDLDEDIVNLFNVIREQPERLAHAIYYTPHSRQEYYNSYLEAENNVEKARRLIVRLWQGRGGKTAHRTGWRSMIEGNGPLPGKEWLAFPDKVVSISERLKGVQIEKQPAVKLIQRYARQNVLIYADPPYLLNTRTTTAYKHEMSDRDHEELLKVLIDHPGPVLLSGYKSDLYEEILSDWKNETISSVAEAGAKREEVLWLNPIAADWVYGLRLC
ncbi:DNA methyltransferase [Bacillaceae bacterium JMAK1]|nr:DNA methyltransferase [Bacillaceae bacterium JMAK1]